MAKIDSLLNNRIEETEARYKRRSKDKNKRLANLKIGGDWRQVETPQRVLRRMVALGLDDLAGSALASEAVTEGVDSAVRSGKKVGLLERIIEENDLLSARFLHIGSSIARTVGRVLIRSRGRTVGYGTGFLVSSRLLMTNNHVLESAASAARSLVEFDYYERQGGRTGPTKLYELDPDSFFLTDDALDFTLVAVAQRSERGQPLVERGRVSLIPESGKALVGEPVNIIQHPGGAPQQIAIKNNQITDRVPDFLHYVADTEPGSSGSPVFNMQWKLAALHHSGVPDRNDRGRILLRDGTVWDGSRDAADRIAWIANEGVRISSIVRFVQEALGDDKGQKRDLFEEATSGDVQLAPAPPSATAVTLASSVPPAMELDDETLDRLTPEEVAQIVADLEEQSFEITQEAAAPGEVLVAEGDSWFDYSFAGLDIIDCLRMFYNYRIHNVAEAGDILDNMAWGTEYDRNWRRKRPPLEKTLAAVRKYRPRVVLLSGGGNDIAGIELLSFLNHKESGLDSPLRQPYTDFLLKTYFRKAYDKIIQSIWEIDDSIQIVTHGYGYGIPDGRAVIRIIGLSFIGPWLRPALTAKGYFQKKEREEIVHGLIDKFNEMLEDLAHNEKRIHYIDLRRVIKRSDWENELHLRNSGYKRVAGKFDGVIRSILGQVASWE
ncbi:MAG: trypsin-like peptidase domain-containing protein [bacterium]